VIFAANLGSLWSELPYLDKFEAAAAAGFQGVVVPLPYDVPAKDTQRAALRVALPVVQISAPPPNYAGGERGFAAVPGLEQRFRYDLRRAVRYCAALKAPLLHIMGGPAKGEAARQALLSNLRHAVETVPESICLTLQPQAQEDAFLNDFDLAADIVREVGSPKLGLQFHSHHAQQLQGNAATVFRKHASAIRQVQIGDAPGRGAPGTGQIDFEALFSAMAAADYQGWVVADYVTKNVTDAALHWLQRAAA
jgi:hydroxypyruvate isomerase